jgi:zinc D-Ala-D-Ala dipeptidase
MKMFTVKKFNLEERFEGKFTTPQIRQVFLGLSPDLQTTLESYNTTYVSKPSRDPISPSPHATGGAVDIWPFYEGKPLHLGIHFDWMEDEAGAFYHLKRKRNQYHGNDGLVCENRNKLIYAMTSADFSCYGPEIWHYNYGNQMHSLVTGKPAIYGYIELPN